MTEKQEVSLIQMEIIGTGSNSLGEDISKKIAMDIHTMSESTARLSEGPVSAWLNLIQFLYELHDGQLELTVKYLRKKHALMIEGAPSPKKSLPVKA